MLSIESGLWIELHQRASLPESDRMSRTTVRRTIGAPVDFVFRTVSEIENYSKAIPHIVDVEFLSDVRSGVGSRFRETRLMMGREASTILEVTEYVENDRVRLVSNEGGTVWDSIFTVRPVDDGTELTLVMDAAPYTFKSKVVVPIMKFVVRMGLVKDMDAVKEYCESS